MNKIAIINGPNLNLLGKREPSIYGDLTLDSIKEHTQKKLEKNNLKIDWYQSNLEGEIVTLIQSLVDSDYDALVINPAGYSHTSVAIYDALKILSIPIAEVHLTNVYSREAFRQRLLTARAASIIMGGLGKDAYFMAILGLLAKVE